MKRLLFLGAAIVLLFSISCTNSGNGQLIGVQGRMIWYQPDPFGMLYLPMGSYQMGLNDQDVASMLQAAWFVPRLMNNNEAQHGNACVI